MRASSGEHYVGLDHLRAVALYLVFCWHFLHGAAGTPVPFAYSPAVFPLAVIDEGHTGVSLFMALSGYLFTKLLDGKRLAHPISFLFNRALRLAPMLIVTLLIYAALHLPSASFLPLYALMQFKGLVFPVWPNGGWSITVELHFYVLLPVLLWLLRKNVRLPLVVVAFALALRAWLWASSGSVQFLSYWTLVGRIDQFILGMLAFQLRGFMRGRHGLMAGGALVFCAAYWGFDQAGGYLGLSKSSLWVWLLTFEAAFYGVVIAWYDTSFTPPNTGASKVLAQFGAFSYSTYLLHFFFVTKLSDAIEQHVMSLHNPYVAMVASLVAYAATWPLGFLCAHLIERPFLRLRRRYAEPINDAA